MEKDLLSFCVLCYNHEKFIEKNFQSIWDTGLKNIEIIIVDDGSKDNSVQKINELKEKSPCPCTVVAQENSGNIGHNFNVALKKANGEYVTFISADDFYESKELVHSYNILRENKAYAFVASTKIREVNNTGEYTENEVPPLEVDDLKNPTAKDLLELEYKTLGVFYIQGCLFRKEIVDNVDGFDEDMTGDDIVLRTKIFKYLTEHNNYSFFLNHNPCTCYRRHENNVSRNCFRQMIIVSEYLERYWPERENPQIFYDWLYGTIDALNYNRILDLFSKNLRLAKCLAEPQIKIMLTKKVFVDKVKKNKFLWFVFRVLRKLYRILKNCLKKDIIEEIRFQEGKAKEKLLKKYKGKTSLSETKMAIVMCDDIPIAKGGLCDRLRGIISIFQSCKKEKVDFKLNFVSPFNLTEFLVPNTYNWIVKDSDIQYKKTSLPVFIFSEKGDAAESDKQELLVSDYFSKNYNQFHFWTNAHYSLGKESFYQDFNELFKPSEKLETEIEKYLHQINSDYISVSFRFIQLLGDFKEHYNIYPVLSDNEKSILIEKCLSLLKDLYKKEAKTIFVATDSKTFLKAAQELPFVFTIPGEIAHVDATKDNSFEANKKTFIDFFMIANAEKVYLAHRGKMFYSGFPRTAALSANKPFEVIEF